MKHVIRDYDQARIRLTQLTQDYSARSREYRFLVGDLFNEIIPAGPASPAYAGSMGLDRVRFGQYVGREIDRLLEDSGAGEYISRQSLKQIRAAARSWSKGERTFNVAFTVYCILAAHKGLIRDGMTSMDAERAVAEANGHDSESATSLKLRGVIHRDRQRAATRRHAFNQTQWLIVTANQLAGQLDNFSKGHKEDGHPFSDEDVEKVREMYRVLDEFVTENGIEHIWDLSEAVAA